VSGYHKYTPLRIAVPFILGIVIRLQFPTHWPLNCLILLDLVTLTGLFISFLFIRSNYGLRWVSGILANLGLFILGILIVSVIDRQNTVLKGEGQSVKARAVLCRMDASPAARAEVFTGNASTIAWLDSTGNWILLETEILVYFKNDSLCKSLEYGDLIIASTDLLSIPGPSNPYMFSYKKYLHNRQIFHQVYLEQGQWQKISRAAVNPLFYIADRCRKAFMKTFNDFGIAGQDFALVSALLLGDSEYLDAEIRQEFSYAGATHVLSVSGLHVGIVYIAADKMLFFLKRSRRSRKWHAFLTVAFIWAYALITGLCTSVVRASLMFSLVAAGNHLKRSQDSYNILAVAAFLQLWINPFEITQVGFQLSYLAVLGIFAFYKPFNELISTDNRLISWLWPVIAVSLAAQLATSPLASFYFNMFPVYFLITNLIVVPLAGIIIYLALPLLLAGATGVIYEWLAFPLKWSLQIMRVSVEMIQSWPGAVIQPIVLTPAQVILLYFAIISVFAIFVWNDRKWAFVFLGSCLLFLMISAGERYRKLLTTEIVVYNVPGRTAIDLIDRRVAYFIGDSLLLKDSGKIKFQISPNRMHEGVKEIRTFKAEESDLLNLPGIWMKSPFIYFAGKKIVFIDENIERYGPYQRISCDLAIISGKVKTDPENLLSGIETRQFIIASSVPVFTTARLMGYIEKESVTCHAVRNDGAFVVKW